MAHSVLTLTDTDAQVTADGANRKEVAMSYPINPLFLANSQGIPRLQATEVTVSSTEVKFSFQNQPFLNAPFIGLILFKLPLIPVNTTSTLPVVFSTNGNNQSVINYNTGTEMTAGDMVRSGIYLAIYDSESSMLYVFPTQAA